MCKFQIQQISIALIMALMIVAINVQKSSAHGSLIRSEPADSATVTNPPKEVRLWFSEPISAQFSTAEILDANSQPVTISAIHIDSAEPNLMILTLPELTDGLYSIRWKVLSEADGHFTQGPLVFGVGEGADFSNVVSTEVKAVAPIPEVVLRWINYTLLLALVGGVAMTYLVLAPPGAHLPIDSKIVTLRQAAQQRTLLMSVIFGIGVLLVGVGLLGWQVIALLKNLPDTASIQGVVWQVLGQTRWGFLWITRQGLLISVVFLIFLHWRNSNVQSTTQKIFHLALLTALMGATLAAQSLISHAAAVTPNTILAVIIDVLHLLAASLWVGGLLALAVGLLPLIGKDKANITALLQASWKPFSQVAVLSVVILIATGLYSAGRQVTSIDALITTVYGQTLLSKVGLLLIVGCIGLLNAILLHPMLATPLAKLLGRQPGWTPLSLRRLPTLVLTEVGLGIIILLATGLLTASPTANGPEFAAAANEIPRSRTQNVNDMIVTFSAKPNKPGQNLFSVWAASTRRPAPAEVLRIILRFTFLGEEMGRTSVDAVEVEPGLYQVGGNQLSLAGPWKVQTIVRRAGIEDAVAEFEWMVAPPGEARSVVISNRSLEGILTVSAAGLLLITCLAVIGRLAAKQETIKSIFQKINIIQTVSEQPNETLEPKANILGAIKPHSGKLRKLSKFKSTEDRLKV